MDGANLTFRGNTFSGYSYRVFTRGYGGGCSGAGMETFRIKENLDLKWADGTVFELSGAGNIRLVSAEIVAAETDAASGITVITLKCADGFNPDEFFRGRVTEVQTSVDEVTG